MNETKLDISTPKEQLPTKGFSVIVEAPQGYPIRDNARDKVIAVCAELSEATRIAEALASQAELLEACQVALERLEASQPPKGGVTEQACSQLRKAIAKARGGAE